jgi:hypothetical protein
MGGVPAFWVARDPLISLFRRRYRHWSCHLRNLGLLLGRAFKYQVSNFAFLYMFWRDVMGDGRRTALTVCLQAPHRGHVPSHWLRYEP